MTPDIATAEVIRMRRSGLTLALVSSASFGFAGPLGKSLLETGWSPLGVVLARLTGAGLLLTVPLLVLTRRRTGGRLGTVLVYGVVAVAGAQVCFFNAVQHLSVGVALLLEYLAPVLLIGWTWARTRQHPNAATALGALLAMVGLALVLDVTGDARVDPVGVLWGLGAAVCLSVYFQISAHQDAPSPLVLTAGGMVVGAAAVLAVGLSGALPLRFGTADAAVGGLLLPWWGPLLLLAGVATVVAYGLGIVAIGRLGTRVASFVGLSEVLFAVLAAWWLVAERPTGQQAVGGALVVAGIALIRRAERRPAHPLREPATVAG
jgi:drug/metabolite transporter (DMT)-like permease